MGLFSSPPHPDWLWDPHSLLSSGYRCFFLRDKAAGAWSWPLIFIERRGQECLELYLYSPGTHSWDPEPVWTRWWGV